MQKQYRKATWWVFFIILSVSAKAQGPYSIFGIGTTQNNPLPVGSAMGGVGVGLRDSNNINFLNPASYSAFELAQAQIGFETNIYNRLIQGFPDRDIATSLNQVALGFPIIHRRKFNWGLMIGYQPFSSLGYKVFDTTVQVFGVDTLTLREQYDGDGGLNRVFIGNGFRLFKGLSVGFNAGILFGTSNRNSALIFPSGTNYLSSRVQEKTRVLSFSFDAGIQYEIRFPSYRFFPKSNGTIDTVRRNYSFTIGATFGLGQSINADFQRLGILFLPNSTEFGVDTFELQPSSSGRIILPHTFGVGFQISNMNIWKIVTDFNYGKWSDFRYFDQTNTAYFDSYSFHIGGEYKPLFKDALLGKGTFFKNIIYRAGFRYHNMPLRPDGNPVQEIGISFGLGLPVGMKTSYLSDLERKDFFSFINLGMEFGVQQSTTGSAVNDNFFRLNVGITLRDLWFQRRRFY